MYTQDERCLLISFHVYYLRDKFCCYRISSLLMCTKQYYYTIAVLYCPTSGVACEKPVFKKCHAFYIQKGEASME